MIGEIRNRTKTICVLEEERLIAFGEEDK